MEVLFDKFEIIECLKKDHCSGVYIANHIYLGKKILLKSLNTRTIMDRNVINRFKREAKILAGLDHPNIIKVLDFGLFEDYFYISFEYFESKNLRELMESEKLSNTTKHSLTAQLFKGLEYAHSRDIIHRDIKPENILVNSEGELKLGDFGLALVTTDNTVTNQFGIVGTPSYMSPEQIQGQELSACSDLFSTGIVIYELYSEKTLFVDSDLNKILNKIIGFSYSQISEEVEEFPDIIKEIAKGCLQKKCEDRIASSAEILGLLGESNEGSEKPHGEVKRTHSLLPWGVGFIVIVIASIIFFTNNTEKPQIENSPIIKIDTSSQKPSEKEKTSGAYTAKEKENRSTNEIANTNSEISETAFPKQVAIEYGQLFVECKPWAHVYIDSIRLETTPLKKNITLRTGEHSLLLHNPGYPKYEKIISIGSNEVSLIKIDLDSLVSYLAIKVFPWGQVQFDGNILGDTPFLHPIRLENDHGELRIVNPQYPDFKYRLELTKGDTITLSYNFKTGKLKKN